MSYLKSRSNRSSDYQSERHTDGEDNTVGKSRVCVLLGCISDFAMGTFVLFSGIVLYTVMVNNSGYMTYAPPMTVAILLIISGVVLFISFALSCLGATRRIRVLLAIYIIGCIISIILMFTIFIITLQTKSDVRKSVMASLQIKYQNNRFSTGLDDDVKSVDHLQKYSDCCGFTDPLKDFAFGIPASCCREKENKCSMESPSFRTQLCSDREWSTISTVFDVCIVLEFIIMISKIIFGVCAIFVVITWQRENELLM